MGYTSLSEIVDDLDLYIDRSDKSSETLLAAVLQRMTDLLPETADGGGPEYRKLTKARDFLGHNPTPR